MTSLFSVSPSTVKGWTRRRPQLVQKHCVQGRNVALFVTHGSREGDIPELQQWLAKLRQAAGRANIVDVFDCQGELARGLKMFMSIMPNAKYRRWAKMDTSKGQPDESRLERARLFSRNVMKKVHGVNPRESRAGWSRRHLSRLPGLKGKEDERQEQLEE